MIDSILEKHINDLTKKDWEYLYIEKEMGLTKLSNNFGVCAKTVTRRMDYFSIKRRKCGNKSKLQIDKEILASLYEGKKWGIAKIARKFSVSDSVIRRLLIKNNISLRGKSIQHKVPKKLLKKLYVDERRRIDEIVEITGVDRTALYRYFHKYGFDVKESSKSKLNKAEEEKVVSLYSDGHPSTYIADKMGVNTNTVFIILHKHGVGVKENNFYTRKLPSIEEIKRLYVEEEKTPLEISEMFGAHKSSVTNIMRREGIVFRSKSESKKGDKNNMYGKDHTKETRGKMSSAYNAEVRDINEQFGRGNPEKVETPLQDVVTVRSSWEGAVCRYFNDKSIKYLYEPKRIELVIDGVNTTYTPDFIVYLDDDLNSKYYLEVKGLWNDVAKKKVRFAIEAGYNIIVWEGKDLIEKGILDRSFRPLY